MEHIAKKIQELRLKHNLSQGDLADKLGVSRQAISKWEREEGLPDLYNIKKLAEIFKVSVDELVMDGGSIIIDYRNKTSVLLMSIPMGFIAIGTLILLFFTVGYGVVITGDIFTLGRMVLYINLQWVYVPLGLIISIILLNTFINLLSNYKVNLSKVLAIIMYSLVLTVSLLALLEFELNGFSTIFLYICGFIILVVGLVGVILFQKDVRLNTGIREKKSINISFKVLKAISLAYVLIFSLSAIQTYVLTKPLRYLDEYAINCIDDSLYFLVSQDASNSDIRHFNVNINYYVELPQDIQEAYVKIYMMDKVVAEGNLFSSINGDFNYEFEMNQADYELPLLLTDNQYSSPMEIKCVVTYVQSGINLTETIYPELRQNRPLTGLVKEVNLWIWDFKEYI